MLVGIFLATVFTTTTLALDELPPAATGPVDFVRDIQPIFQKTCLKCHGAEEAKGGFPASISRRLRSRGDSDALPLCRATAGQPLDSVCGSA